VAAQYTDSGTLRPAAQKAHAQPGASRWEAAGGLDTTWCRPAGTCS